jgi:hypothetical protein
MAICNLDFIQNITPGSTTFPIKVIQLFLKETPLILDDLKNAVNDQKWDLAYSEAHKIKPSVLMLGFPSETTDALLALLKNTQTKTNTEEVTKLYFEFTKRMPEIYTDLEISLKNMIKNQNNYDNL